MAKNEIKETITVSIGSINLEGELILPRSARGLVLFAHGSGSSRFSPRNNFVARILRGAGMGTLLFDLLSEEEDQIYENRFNIELLTERLLAATKWIEKNPEAKNLALGYFGASTGSAAALAVAAKLGPKISAVISRGGRPDMVPARELARVKAPTLLIVGGADADVLELNKQAYAHLKCTKELAIVPKATHLFEEPGALEEVARLAAEWFKKYLKSR